MPKRASKRLMEQRSRNNYIFKIKEDIVCPFSDDITLYSIACNSLIKGASNYTKFKTKDELKNYTEKYCCDMQGYTKCPIYCMHCIYLEILEKKRLKKERMDKLKIIK